MNGQLAHLLFTDPPYNIRYAELNNTIRGNGAKDWSTVYCQDWKDEMSDEDYRTFLVAVLRNAKQHLVEYAHYYVWYATPYITYVWDAFKENDIYCDIVPIIWEKEHFPQTWMRYKRLYEPCIFGGKSANASNDNARWFGANNAVNIWKVKRDHNSTYIHPTQKPTQLAQIALENSTLPGETVLDLFGGSGSTLIAADSMKRSAYLMELEPRFVDGIVRRYIRYCGLQGKSVTVTKNGEVISNEIFTNEVNDIERNAQVNDE
jgi:DNA modification methylase